jgi:hypothetical protein
LKKIGKFAFANCSNLERVEFGEDSRLTVINVYAFGGTALKCITIPSSVKVIRALVFADCPNLTTVYFEANSRLKKFATTAFDKCPSGLFISSFCGDFQILQRALSYCHESLLEED